MSDVDIIRKQVEEIRDSPKLTQAEKIALLEKILMGFCIVADKEYQLCKRV
jgi:hypothetical protein